MSPFDEDPSDNRSELDMCIDEIKQLQATIAKQAKEIADVGTTARWRLDEIKKQDKKITERAEEIKSLEAGYQAMYQYLVQIRRNPGIVIAKALATKKPVKENK